MSRFDGYRVYNGCPDSTMQRRLDLEDKQEKELIERLKIHYKNVSYTYFPNEEFYLVFADYRIISDECESRIGALDNALRKVR